MSTWQLQEAKARFSEVVDTATRKGPQVITRRGVQTAVVLSFPDWQRLQQSKRAKESHSRHKPLTEEQKLRNDALLDLLRSGPEFEVPPRGRMRLRKPVQF